jgi:hypothetical protein
MEILHISFAEHRHVGSTNFNLLSSRSHTIFTLTVESSPCGESNEGEAVTFSQLNLIDLAGSESSRAETTGVRRKEGSYINKSLLTLGTVSLMITVQSLAVHQKIFASWHNGWLYLFCYSFDIICSKFQCVLLHCLTFC